MRFLVALLFGLGTLAANAQSPWTWTELDTMPKRIANNAVAMATVNGVPHVYSFAGIDSTKIYSGIGLDAMRYNTQTGVWDVLPDMPDTMTQIAAGANTVNNIIYVIGGYHVFANGNEVSSDRVHRFDPENNVWLTPGAPIPVPIDDQVQAVWRDSLIFVVTGWSNTGNVPDVQIYNPYTDTWTAGTSTPNDNNYRAFGASGTIVGDTIYYNGGAAMGFNFPGRAELRKGVIDPNDPTQITWTHPSLNPGDKGYRMACTSYGNKIFWIGGSGTTYNYNGIAYNGTGGVEPLHRILTYDTEGQWWNEGVMEPWGVMDLRGIAQIASNQWIICGGMTAGQTVTNKAFLLELDTVLVGIDELEEQPLLLYPNPAASEFSVQVPANGTLNIFNAFGQLVLEQRVESGVNRVESAKLASGTYTVNYWSEDGMVIRHQLLQIR